jgi:hypothetical protein
MLVKSCAKSQQPVNCESFLFKQICTLLILSSLCNSIGILINQDAITMAQDRQTYTLSVETLGNDLAARYTPENAPAPMAVNQASCKEATRFEGWLGYCVTRCRYCGKSLVMQRF